jgi:hypothetical protein
MVFNYNNYNIIKFKVVAENVQTVVWVGWLASLSTGKGTTHYQLLKCPMKLRFRCDYEIKVTRALDLVTPEMRGTHDADSHAPEKDVS